MRWEELLSAKRCRGGQTRGRNAKSSDLRSEFEKDYHRIIGFKIRHRYFHWIKVILSGQD